MSITLISENRQHGGWHRRYSHQAASTHCEMSFAVFLPPHFDSQTPVLYWLSGLTCNDQNVMQKSGIQRIAAELGIMIVAPDTSPRGEGVADDSGYDLGQGAGFYVNATEAPWASHFKMYDYIVEELPAVIEQHFKVSDKRSISGHSMGGHGALMIGLRNPQRYCSISAFSPIVNPIACPWGQKAFSHYLGNNPETWQAYDATFLMHNYCATKQPAILIDQGSADEFLQEQLDSEAFQQAAQKANYPLQYRLQEGYDHSYFFISSFIDAHVRFHGEHLLK